MKSKKPWLLIDGSNLAFRSFYAVPPLTRQDGFPTNALHGWVRSCWKLEDSYTPQGVLVIFDKGGAQKRLQLLPEYKAQRKETPEALRAQLPVLRELSALMGYTVIEESGIEADDILAAYASFLSEQGEVVWIVSADKDFAQCLNANVGQLLAPSGESSGSGWLELQASGVKDKMGIEVIQVADYLALVGDVADNIPGLAGVGPKTAQKWLSLYGSLAAIFAAASTLDPARFRTLVAQSEALLRRNLELTTLDRTVISCTVPPASLPQAESLVRFLNSMELNRIAAQVPARLQPLLF